MECPICLESIGPGSILGRIHGCQHTYHSQCVEQWVAHSNLCPTCRQPFYSVDFVAFETPHTVINTVSTKDRILGTDAIDQIPPEFVLLPQAYASQQRSHNTVSYDSENAHFGVCLICSSAQYSRQRNNHMVACISCGSKFHTACLGHSGEPSWFCPVCDCHQEFPVTIPRAGPAVNVSIVQRSISPRRTAPTTQNMALSNRRGRLVLAEDSDVPDSAEFPDSGGAQVTINTRPRTAVWNGGALLRRQARELQNLTPEELSSWNILESARRGVLGEGTGHTDTALSAPRRKRRPRAIPLNAGSATDPNNNNCKKITNRRDLERLDEDEGLVNSPISILDSGALHGPSRIASLMSQIRTRPVIQQKAEFRLSNSPQSTQNEAKPHLHNTGNMSIGSPSRLQSPVNLQIGTPGPMSPRPLSLEEKLKVQTHVRNNLRPLYHNAIPGAKRIASEDEYIRINKGISRKVYSYILSLGASQGPLIYGNLFGESDEKLKRLVDSCVEGWPFDQ